MPFLSVTCLVRGVLRAAPRPTHLRRRVSVRVYLNTQASSMLDGYTPDALLVLAYSYTIPADNTLAHEQILERVFAALNGFPEHPDDRVHTEAWEARDHHSLSVGDVVVIGDRHYARNHIGWASVTARLP